MEAARPCDARGARSRVEADRLPDLRAQGSVVPLRQPLQRPAQPDRQEEARVRTLRIHCAAHIGGARRCPRRFRVSAVSRMGTEEELEVQEAQREDEFLLPADAAH
jgi:hypothetical protein